MSDPNYITREGAQKLQDELGMLRSKERPKVVQEVSDAAAQGDRSENAEYKYGKQRLREIDRRMRFLTKRLEAAQIVTPQAHASGKIFFGAWVSVEDEDGVQTEYRIVGEDEIDLRKKCISYRSPLGRALLKKEEGDTVKVQRPTGEVELTVIGVRYA
jgi:transcription elongation factor GreB